MQIAGLITAPAQWASWLINGDDSGMDSAETERARQWLARALPAGAAIVGMADDSERFTWNYRAHGGDSDGGDVADYQTLKPVEMATADDLDSFTSGYIEALFFTDSGPDSDIPDGMGFYELAPESKARIIGDCAAFRRCNSWTLAMAESLPDYSAEQAGRDLHFTRNGHGVGFWERQQLPKAIRDRLTRAAGRLGQLDAYIGDDGAIHLE